MINNDQKFAVIRHVLTAFGGVLVARGQMDESSMTEVVGAIITLAGFGWSLYIKRAGKPQANTTPLIVIGLLMLALMTSGCATTPNDIKLAQVGAGTASAYYNQPNNADFIQAEGDNIEFKITGCKKLTFSGPIPSKSIYPRDEGALSKTITGVTDLAKIAGLTFVGGRLATTPRTVKPDVVTTEKLVPVVGAQ
jgi:hypothetical protein